MLGITVGVLIACFIGFLTARFALPRAGKSDVGKLALITTGLGLALLALAAASCNVKTFNRAAISAEPIQALSTNLPERVLVEGIISDAQDAAPGSDFAAYIRWSALSERSELETSDFIYELADLELEFGNDQRVLVDGLIYEDINWPISELDDLYDYAHLSRGDSVVVYGELYEGFVNAGGGTTARWQITSPFVFYGDFAAYSAEYHPTLQRTATYAQIVQYISLAAAILITLSPLPHLLTKKQSI